MDRFIDNVPEKERMKIMRKFSRLRFSWWNPLEAAWAYLNLQPYKVVDGWGYVLLRENKSITENLALRPAGEFVDYLDVKIGQTEDLFQRIDDHRRTSKNCVLLERLVHLTLTAWGAKRMPYPCWGCGSAHNEHYSEERCGGLEGVAGVFEFWLREMGEDPFRQGIYF
ncbi:hypothetical protein C8R43DRAFT_965748 [Mycena crocata]|nr:hypothetical protein C8R43DRAFT_965748 [Mycena crocata]